MSDPRPAATLVIVRDGAGKPEVLLTIRPRHLRFMGGAAVFPGGGVAPSDLDPRWEQASSLSGEEAGGLLGEDPRVALGAYVCALRESFEEVGFIAGDRIEEIDRHASHEPHLWLEACIDAKAVLATDRLVPAGRWVTPMGSPIRFDTWFFIASVETGWEPVPDPNEVEECLWLTPADALERLAEGELAMAPPTIEMLQRLATHDSTAAAIESLNREGVNSTSNVLSVRLSPLVHVVLAPNSGVMTGPGTNTYIVGTGPKIVIDPAVDDAEYLDEVLAAAGDVDSILVTHRHEDHVGGVEELARRTGAPVRAFGSEPAGGVTVVPVRDDEILEVEGARLRALHTPGHASDHLCLYLEGAASLFAGDNILGEGTSVIAPPDGNMGAFMASLERLAELDIHRIFPGHFRPLDGGREIVMDLLEHRRARGAAILAAISDAPRTVEEVVEVAYADTPAHLHPIALYSALAHLESFEEEKRATRADGRWSATNDG